ncbi:MAG: GntR family transcriptional regulator [Demequina sp.]|nr:GntR family transcriptional regulator [Demequina sp.]
MREARDQRGRASSRAYTTLRCEILDGQLSPGTVLTEVDQAERLGVSRTPLREALSRLGADGLVSKHAGRGLVVTPVSVDHVTELFEVRQALDGQAARLAARRRDVSVFVGLQRQFQDVEALLADKHRYYELVGELDAAIDHAVGNPTLVATLNGVRTHVTRIRRLAQDDPARLRDAAQEHVQIIDAIVDGEESLAAHATQLHLHRSLRYILKSLERNVP